MRAARSRVPVGGILNLLGSLASRAAQEAAELYPGDITPEYLYGENGEALGDLANPDERADLLWEFLEEDDGFKDGLDFHSVSEDEPLSELFEEGNQEPFQMLVEWDN